MKYGAIFIIFAILLSSCSTLVTSEGNVTESTMETTQEVRMEYIFDDVPLPYGFEIDKEKSFVYKAGVSKSGILTLKGDLSPKDVKDFYIGNLPDYGWSLLNTFEWKEIFMNFHKKGWILTIIVKPRGIEGSEIKLLIGPVENEKGLNG